MKIQLELDKSKKPINIKENISKMFKWVDKNENASSTENTTQFILSLKKYYKKNKLLTDKQFECLYEICTRSAYEEV